MTDEIIGVSHGNEAVKESNTNNLSTADLLELKIRLKDELRILEIAKTSAELEKNSGNVTELQGAVSELNDQLLEESNSVSLKELIIKRFEMHELLCDILFKENKDSRDVKITTNCLDGLQISSEMMRIQKDVETLQETYENLKIDNLRLKQENINLMEKLKNNTEKAHSVSANVTKNKDYRLLKSELDVRSKSLDILKNIIPRLVVGTGKSDPRWQDLVLQCGESLNI